MSCVLLLIYMAVIKFSMMWLLIHSYYIVKAGSLLNTLTQVLSKLSRTMAVKNDFIIRVDCNIRFFLKKTIKLKHTLFWVCTLILIIEGGFLKMKASCRSNTP